MTLNSRQGLDIRNSNSRQRHGPNVSDKGYENNNKGRRNIETYVKDGSLLCNGTEWAKIRAGG